MNSITLDGTVFQPEARVSKAGNTVFTFNLSVYLGKETDKKTSRYGNIKVKCFKALADNAAKEIVDKSHVEVSGKLDFDKWEKDGQKHSRPCIIANSLGLSVSRFGDEPNASPMEDEEIPF